MPEFSKGQKRSSGKQQKIEENISNMLDDVKENGRKLKKSSGKWKEMDDS